MIKKAKTLRGVPFFHGVDADQQRTGCGPVFPGANVPAPAEDQHNENPSLVALGKKLARKLAGKFDRKV